MSDHNDIKSETDLVTPKQLCRDFAWLPMGGLRFMLFNRRRNGLAQAQAVLKVGRKLLIRKSAFMAWVESQHCNEDELSSDNECKSARAGRQ